MSHIRDFAWLAVAWLLLSTQPASGQSPSKSADAKAIAALIAQLGSADFQERGAATRSLETIGRPALAALREAASKHDDAEVRRRAKGLVEKIENSLEQLLEDYRAYGLPLPPKDAPLVRFQSSGGGKSNGVEQPPRYSLGFLLKPGTTGEPPDILRCTFRYQPLWNPPVTLLEPAKATARDIAGWAADAGYDLLPLALQCKARGWDALAQSFFEKKPPDYKSRSPKSALRDDAWSYLESQLSEADSDWFASARRLHSLIESESPLDTTDHRALLKSLDSALVPSKAKPGGIDALIDGLVEVRFTGLVFLEPELEWGDNEPDPRYLRLVEKGFDAVPALIEHLNDDRLTRTYQFGAGISPGHHCRVRHLASELLQDLAGEKLPSDESNVIEKSAARAWWDKAKRMGEEAHLLGHVFPEEGEWPNSHILRVLLKKYPQHLPKVYSELLEQRPAMQSFPVARALVRSGLPRPQKVETLTCAGRHKTLRHRRTAFWELKDVDPEQFVQLLAETLDAPPGSDEEPLLKYHQASLARLVGKTKNDRAWRALEKAAKRADVGLRMEMLDYAAYQDKDQPCKQRLVFLAVFLDDATVRDLKADPKPFDGANAGEDFRRLEVRNYAALEIGRLLKIDRTPQPNWDDEQWANFRNEVREKLKR